jgi:O-antigen ligase
MFTRLNSFWAGVSEPSKLCTLRYGVFTQGSLVNVADDDYLQVLVETGLAGFACFVWFIVLLYRKWFKAIRR